MLCTLHIRENACLLFTTTNCKAALSEYIHTVFLSLCNLKDHVEFDHTDNRCLRQLEASIESINARDYVARGGVDLSERSSDAACICASKQTCSSASASRLFTVVFGATFDRATNTSINAA